MMHQRKETAGLNSLADEKEEGPSRVTESFSMETLRALMQYESVRSRLLVFDMRRVGWTLVEDTGRNPDLLTGAMLRPFPFLERREDRINGEELLRRAKRNFNTFLGQWHAEQILTMGASTLRLGSMLVFPGTKWKDTRGRLRIPCLFRIGKGGRRCLAFVNLEGRFCDRYRLLQIANT